MATALNSRQGSQPLLGTRTLLLGSIAIVLFAAFVTPVNDPDFWWHLAAGQWMLDNRALPAHDLFTYTVRAHVWTDHEYLIEILIALLWKAGGAVLISFVFGVVTWIGFWWIFQAADGFRRSFVIAGVAIALAAVAGGPIWGPRSQMVTFALAALQLLWLRRYLEGRSRRLLWFPLLMVAWANLHSGWAIAFVFLGVAIGSEAVLWVWNDRAAVHTAHLRTLALVTLLSIVAVAATPHGLALYAYPFQTQFSTAQQSLIAEWFSPNFHEPYLYALLALILLLMAGYAWRRPSLYDLLLALVTLALALHSVRQSTIFIAAVMPSFIKSWTEAWTEEIRPRLGSWFAPGGRPSSRLFSVTTAVALAVVVLVTGLKIAGGLRMEQTAIAADFPVATSDWIASHPDEVGTRMFNQYGWGGYLIYRFYPAQNRQVFIFGEAELMGDSFLYQYQDIQTLRPNWRQLLDRYKVDYIVYNRGEALDNVLRTEPGWRLVHQDSVAVVYVRAPSVVPVSNTAAPGS